MPAKKKTITLHVKVQKVIYDNPEIFSCVTLDADRISIAIQILQLQETKCSCD